MEGGQDGASGIEASEIGQWRLVGWPVRTSECGWSPIAWIGELCSQPESSWDGHLWLLSLPHGFRCNPGFLRGHCAKVSRLKDKIATFDGNVPGLRDAVS